MNKTVKVDSKSIEGIIYVAFLLGYLLQTSYLPTQFRSIRVIMISCYCVGYLFCAFKLLTFKYTAKCFVLTLIFVLTGIATLISNKSIDYIIASTMLNFLLVTICVKSISLEKIIRIDLIAKISFTLILVILCCCNVVKNVMTTRISGAVRYSMGFAHPNRFGAMLFLIVLYLAYVRREKLNLKDIFFQLFIFVVTYKLTDSRSSELGIAIVIIFTVLSLLHKRRKSKNFSKTQRYIIVIVAISMIAAMFYLAANYDSNNSKMSILNMLFNSRLELGGLTLKYYKPSLFGAGIQTYAWEDVLSQGMSHALVGSDILYLYIYLNYGIISLFIYLYVIVVAIIYAAKVSA